MVPEVQLQDQEYKLLRRRVAIVLGQWVPVQPEKLNTNAIYQIFQYLLNKDDPLNDLVVRITAGRQLSKVVEPYEFTAEQFLPFAQSILGNLMSLVQEVEVVETKMGLLETVRVVVVKLEHLVSSVPPLRSLCLFFVARLHHFPMEFSHCFHPCGRSRGRSI